VTKPGLASLPSNRSEYNNLKIVTISKSLIF
jgi:hypothetical protein